MHGADGALEVQTPRSYISGPTPARVGALLAENCAQKNQKLFPLDKNNFSDFSVKSTKIFMKTAVFIYENVCVYSFSLCVCLDVNVDMPDIRDEGD